jgi:hypothetical protein
MRAQQASGRSVRYGRRGVVTHQPYQTNVHNGWDIRPIRAVASIRKILKRGDILLFYTNGTTKSVFASDAVDLPAVLNEVISLTAQIGRPPTRRRPAGVDAARLAHRVYRPQLSP